MRRDSRLLDSRIKSLYYEINRLLSSNQSALDQLTDLTILLYKQGLISELTLDQCEIQLTRLERVIALRNSSPFAGESSTCQLKANALSNRVLSIFDKECNLSLLVSMNTTSLKSGINDLMRRARFDPNLQAAIDEILRRHGVAMY